MISKIRLLFDTVKHLKIKQMYYQLFYRIMPVKQFKDYHFSGQLIPFKLSFQSVLPMSPNYLGEGNFIFLNLEKTYTFDNIDWNENCYGKLWNYNLQYLNYLSQTDINNVDKWYFIQSLQKALNTGGLPLEPYPVSLRIINIIRFLNGVDESREEVLKNLAAELEYLYQHLEFHIMGNHLLENAFALTMGVAYFNNAKWYRKGSEIINAELREQILDDGAHFELSPMYHQIIFYRVLELIDWISNYDQADEKFKLFLVAVASKMKSWLMEISFANGDIPLFNDAAKGITYETNALLSYADRLGIMTIDLPLRDSGYRSFKGDRYEVKVDTAQIGADYQPGHAHADALSFILYLNDSPLFVEQGTSTYQIGERRDLERSTQAHNTVVVAGKNQSEVWGGFRVGKRATTVITRDEASNLEAHHTGYKNLGVLHKRSFKFEPELIEIQDTLNNQVKGVFYLHLHPSRTIQNISESIFLIDEDVTIIFENALDIKVEEYSYADTYNQYFAAQRLRVDFAGELQTILKF